MTKGKGKKRAAGEGHVRQRPDGLWETRISIPGGKPKSFYGKTQAEALRKRNELRLSTSEQAWTLMQSGSALASTYGVGLTTPIRLL